jgi:cytochrome c553
VKIRISVVAAVIAMTIANMSAAQAADATAAAQKAKTVCAGCHGPEGISTNPIWPNIAGQKEQYLVKTLKEYRDNIRPDPNMAALALSLTDEEIEGLAAYYAGL